MKKTLSTGAEIINLGITILLLLFLNFGIMPIISEQPDYPSVVCDPAKGPLSPTGCGTEFDAAQATYQERLATHEQVVFYASIIIGIGLLVGGLFLRIPAVTWGIMLSGAAQFAIGSTMYWEHLNKYVGALILGLGVALLILMAWRFTKR